MAIPSRLPDHRSPKRQQPFYFADEDEEEEDDDDYSDASDEEEEIDEEDDEESSDVSVDEEEIDEEEVGVEIAGDVVGGTRIATNGNDFDDVTRSENSTSSSSSSQQQSVTLKNSYVLDCPTCCEPLKKPIYQCTKGHIACSSCCKELKKRCTFCRSHIGDIRCRAMEKVIEASIVPCRNAIYGCKETTSYDNQSSHEKLCVFVRCSCPLPNCDYIGSYANLKSHALALHSSDEDKLIPLEFDSYQIFSMNLNKEKMTIFQEEKEGDLIVVQAFKGSHGVYVTVSCIVPVASKVHDLSCSLAKLNGYSTLRLGLMVKKVQKVEEQEDEPKDGYMMIPNYMVSGDHLKLQICIGSEYKYVHI